MSLSSIVDDINSARSIAFFTVGGSGMFGLDFLPTMNYLWPKPEDTQYQQPTRASVVQTFGGAYIDDFGEGVTEAVISGTTGYRRMLGDVDTPMGGELAIILLRDLLLKQFHADRQSKAASGQDPNSVKLYMLDMLNDLLCVVYPLSFQLRRSKQRPLLFQYTIRVAVLEKWDVSDAMSAITDVIEDAVTDLF